jgi:hypothetical protein
MKYLDKAPFQVPPPKVSPARWEQIFRKPPRKPKPKKAK